MFSKSSGLVFLAISLCVQAVPYSFQEQCNGVSTVTHTVTVMAHASETTKHDGGNSHNDSNERTKDSNDSAKGSNATNKGTVNDATATRQTSSATPLADDKHKGHSIATATTQHGDDRDKHDHSSTTARASSTSVASTSASKGKSSATNVRVGNSNGNNNNNSQTSLTLDAGVIAEGFANDGQNVSDPDPGQVSSLTSTNNFINFCLTVPNLKITNGQQITAGSCNPAPMGIIPSSDNMPSAKFTFPQNFGTLKANQSFTVQMAIKNMEAGFFVNADENYFAAPQQVNAQGQVKGHSHIVIEKLSSLQQTTPTNPKIFTFFKGLNAAPINGILNATVPHGLDVGDYKLSSINTAANHQPVLVPVAQHGSLDDAIYFSVTSDGVAASNGGERAASTSGSGKSGAAHSSTTAKADAAATSTHSSDSHDHASASPTPTSQASTKGKRSLSNRFSVKF